KAGEQKRIHFTIDNKMLRFYHPDHKNWVIEEGEFMILIGNSSNDIQLEQKIKYLKL
ncbi:fibronectin type III-like domain-contianing protein, partial [bacterium]|nr:fibronectin type III-like domain-contianing protein [bacterium]